MRHVVAWGLCASVLVGASDAWAQSANFTVKNQSAWTVHHLYVSSSNVSQWGPDQLGEEVIVTGDSFTITSIPCDTYDMKIVDEDGDECVMNKIPMCGSSSSYTITSDNLVACIGGAAPAPSGTFQAAPTPIVPSGPASAVTVQNYSSWSIHRLYLSPSSVSTWGDDRLGTGTIPSGGGNHTLYNIPCDTYDIKLVDEDDDECVIKGVRLCGQSQTWTITSENLLACQAGN